MSLNNLTLRTFLAIMASGQLVAAVVPGQCVACCQGVPDGDYQSCRGCGEYASCGGGLFYGSRPCPGGLQWDDKKKLCDWSSTTCSGPQSAPSVGCVSGGDRPEPASTTPSATRCITSCNGIPDGDYQSCLGCTVYASCGGGLLYDPRPCPVTLVWDDNVKRCEYTSTTCTGGSTTKRVPTVPTVSDTPRTPSTTKRVPTIPTASVTPRTPSTTIRVPTVPTASVTPRTPSTTKRVPSVPTAPFTPRTVYVTLKAGGWLPNVGPATGNPGDNISDSIRPLQEMWSIAMACLVGFLGKYQCSSRW